MDFVVYVFACNEQINITAVSNITTSIWKVLIQVYENHGQAFFYHSPINPVIKNENI